MSGFADEECCSLNFLWYSDGVGVLVSWHPMFWCGVCGVFIRAFAILLFWWTVTVAFAMSVGCVGESLGLFCNVLSAAMVYIWVFTMGGWIEFFMTAKQNRSTSWPPKFASLLPSIWQNVAKKGGDQWNICINRFLDTIMALQCKTLLLTFLDLWTKRLGNKDS